MANVFLNIAVPGSGIGAPTDVSTAGQEKTQIVAAPAVDILAQNSFDYDVASLEPGDFLGYNLTRDARGSNPDDTLGGNVNLVTIAVRGTFWR